MRHFLRPTRFLVVHACAILVATAAPVAAQAPRAAEGVSIGTGEHSGRTFVVVRVRAERGGVVQVGLTAPQADSAAVALESWLADSITAPDRTRRFVAAGGYLDLRRTAGQWAIETSAPSGPVAARRLLPDGVRTVVWGLRDARRAVP